MYNYEITYQCADDDWLSWRVKCTDFHEAVEMAMVRINMANISEAHKLYAARLLRVELIRE